VPGNASRERLDRIRAHGAEVIETDPMEGYDFAIEEARRLAEREPDRYWYCNQYDNPDNWRAHYDGTGTEILDQLAGRGIEAPDAFVCGIGTGGSITGVTRRLREDVPEMAVVAVLPEEFPGIEGLKPLGRSADIVPGILDRSLLERRTTVTAEQALRACGRLAREGIFVGPSSGAYVHAALRAAQSGRYRRIVTILCDTGERYYSTGMWSDRNVAAGG
jgi:cysteine synthase B